MAVCPTATVTLPSLTQVDTWLDLVFSHHAPFSLLPARRGPATACASGAASGAAAIDVALHKICFIGNWSIKLRAVFDYIDLTCPRTPACWRHFGWLAPQ